jgi:pentatricopeptide repeat protein
MLPALRLRGILNRSVNYLLPSLRPASSGQNFRTKGKGKKPEDWTVEEVGERLGRVEEQVARGETLLPRHLATLLAPIRLHRNRDDLSRVLEVVRRSGITLDEGLGSALVSSLAERGRVDEVREMVEQMQGRLRVQSQSSVLAMACSERDADLAVEFLASRQSPQPLPASLVRDLVALSRETGRPDLVEQLLGVVRETRQPLTGDGVAQLRLWAASQPQPYTCELTTVSSSGVCTNCQGRLEKALTEGDHQKLLRAVNEAVHSEGLGFSPELISNLSRLQKRLSAVSSPYKVVVDGLNVSRVSSKNFSVMQVMDIVNQLTGTVGGPVLVVARKHLAKEMDQLPSFYSSVPRSHDFHVFTTHINEISDDICVIYAALTTGRHCYIVSNDHMSDNASMLGPEDAKLFSIWQASRQITVQPTTVNLLVGV